MTQSPITDPSPPSHREPSWQETMAYPLACLGALLGAALGAGATRMAMYAGLYAIMVVGVLTGLGAITLSRRGGWGVAIIAVIVALSASLCTEWWCFPFDADDSLGYFVRHIGDLPPFSLLMHAIGAAAAGFIAWRR